jgi:5-methylcytosine-specific restriction protein A
MNKNNTTKNLPWTRDETLLAMNIYIELEEYIPVETHPTIQELSSLLKKLPIYPIDLRKDNFRSPASIVFKLCNFRSLHSPRGLANASQNDREIFEQYKNNPTELRHTAHQIKENALLIDESMGIDQDVLEEETFAEGKILTYLHRHRERSPSLRKKLISTTLSRGELTCSACGYQSIFKDKSLNQSMFECHHIIPLSKIGPQKTTLRDVALLCANCHRAIHALIASQKRWIPLDEFKKSITNQT